MSILHWKKIKKTVLKEKPYEFSLTSNKLWLSVSKALDKSINTVPNMFPSSRVFLLTLTTWEYVLV